MATPEGWELSFLERFNIERTTSGLFGPNLAIVTDTSDPTFRSWLNIQLSQAAQNHVAQHGPPLSAPLGQPRPIQARANRLSHALQSHLSSPPPPPPPVSSSGVGASSSSVPLLVMFVGNFFDVIKPHDKSYPLVVSAVISSFGRRDLEVGHFGQTGDQTKAVVLAQTDLTPIYVNTMIAGSTPLDAIFGKVCSAHVVTCWLSASQICCLLVHAGHCRIRAGAQGEPFVARSYHFSVGPRPALENCRFDLQWANTHLENQPSK